MDRVAKNKLLLTLGVGYLCTQLPNIKKVELNDDLEIFDLEKKQIIVFITEDNKCNSLIVIDLNSKSKKINLITLEKKLQSQNKSLVELYNENGVIEVIKNLNKNLKLSIQQYLKVDYMILEKIINDINGIEIDLKKEDKFQIGIKDKMDVCLLNGEQAIKYIKFKNKEGCTKKDKRQKKLFKNLINKLMESSPKEFINIMSKSLDSIETTMGTKELVTLGFLCIKIGVDNIEKIKIPSKNKKEQLNFEKSDLNKYKIESSIDEIRYILNN